MTWAILSVRTMVSCTTRSRHLSRYCTRSRKTTRSRKIVSARCRTLSKILSRVWVLSRKAIESDISRREPCELNCWVPTVVILGLLQLGRARVVITILSARSKVNDFKDNLFMGVLCFEDIVG